MRTTIRGPVGAIAAAAFLCLALGACTSAEAGAGKPAAGAGTAAPSATDSTGTDAPTDPAPSTSDSPGTDDPTSASPGDTGSDADKSDVADVTERFMHAFGNKDGVTACDLMTDELRAGIGAGSADNCAAAFPTRAAAVGEAELGRLTRVSVDDSRVEVTGTTAQVPSQAITAPGTNNTDSPDDTITLTRLGADWKISGIGS